ncbi:hypothetical protein, unknown function [Leishmania infantum JPCM5]|uniref:Uncharacterized protein n=2 Tax=Leishmania infantum TaxID=5671 RepID=A4I7P9_LEIIN|nr:hypothetical protein, unknown function [Leishmania infantum JPCM5]CAC9523796.1 hypothetical_protein_-_conserved [Leishmania infantum]CAM70835.1 hypothetical protein, unknown function [Leishmania infantum JPCM5]SUZ44652.1 hypothetical_protein_-_conserved [Leishmania infantum]|eukprot:XP_001467768.1 hypothetical protein, unknown function [Leishmania infantum JPCM5]
MSQESSTSPPTRADRHKTSTSPSRSGSTSSSNTNIPCESALQLGPTLWVEMWENQRWYPVIGWGTSRFLTDLPVFCFVPPAYRLCGAHPNDFDAAFHSVNPPSPHSPNPQWPARRILTVALPAGYRWVGFWEVHTEHPHGTDTAGWRYGEQFLRPVDGANADPANAASPQQVLAPFKKTHTPLCVVRRRLWRRRVALAGVDEPASSTDDLFPGHSEQQLHSYLSEKEEEMEMAEHLKEAEFMAAQAGEPWSQEQQMRAEEELRKFCRERQNRESASRMRTINPSFANPFRQPEGSFHVSPDDDDDGPTDVNAHPEEQFSGAVAAASWVRDSRSNRAAPAVSSPVATPDDTTAEHSAESSHGGCTVEAYSTTAPSRVDGSDLVGQNTVQEFVASTPTDAERSRTDGADAAAENAVDQFVASSPTDPAALSNDDQSTGVSIGGIRDPTDADFRAIFSQFMTPSGGQKPS